MWSATGASDQAAVLELPLQTAIKPVKSLSKARGQWIHQQTCEMLADTYVEAQRKISNMLADAKLLITPQELQRRVEPAVDMVVTAVEEGRRFLETCRGSPDDKSSSNEGAGAPVRQLTRWLQKALILSHATDATNAHLHDLLVAFSAISAAIEDAVSKANEAGLHKNRSFGSQQPNLISIQRPDLFWKNHHDRHVLLVSGNALDHRNSVDEGQIELVLERHRDKLELQQSDGDANSGTVSDLNQLALLVKEKRLCSKQSFEEPISPACLCDIKALDMGEIIFPTDPEKFHIARVRKVTWLGREFALKEYRKAGEAFLQEARIHGRLHHPNVIHAIALFQGEKRCGILMDLMDESLHSFLQRNRSRLSLQEKVSVMLRIAKGMAYVHGRGVMHRDLKTQNVLVKSEVLAGDAPCVRITEVKVADFGTAKAKSNDSASFTTKRVGTSVYRAPEVLKDDDGYPDFTLKYKRSADVYSFAITCFELLAEKEPFQDSTYRGDILRQKICEGSERPNLKSISDAACPPYLKHCLSTWWSGNPDSRHTFAHICSILRHMYACLARYRSSVPLSQIVQQELPFMAWSESRYNRAQEIAQASLQQLAERRGEADWKDKGYACESTRVNEIPYEMHVMSMAIKKVAAEEVNSDLATSEISTAAAAAPTEEEAAFENEEISTAATEEEAAVGLPGTTGGSREITAAVSSLGSGRRASSDTTNLTGRTSNSSTNYGSGSMSANAAGNAPAPKKGNWQLLKEFCCFSPSTGLLSTHEAFHPDIQRRN